MNNQINNFLHIIQLVINQKFDHLLDPDWYHLVEIAKQQNLLPLFNEGCVEYGKEFPLPQGLQRECFEQSTRLIIWQAKRTSAFLSVYDKLAEAGLKPFILKGLICRSIYGSYADHRPSSDEDIYIKKEDFPLTKKILTEQGFQMEQLEVTDKLLSQVQEISFFNKEIDLLLEVHLNVMGNENSVREKMNTYFEAVHDNYMSMEIDGHMIYTLNPTDHYLYLFLHFFKHFTLSGIGIRQVIDLFMFDKVYHNQIDWKVVEDRIQEVSAYKLYLDVMSIGKQYLGFSVDTYSGGYCVQTLLEDILEGGCFGNESRDYSLSANIATSAMNEHNKLRLLRVAFPESRNLIKGYPILFKRPYLLPFIWIVRLTKFVLYKGGTDKELLTKSLKIGNKRVQLLKEYGILA
ncbi:MAG: nucleotidyltransferase family protein [Mobilitalea sp.]